MSTDQPSYVVAIFGGACAGSTVAEILANRGCRVVVFEQNARPYGKIEDGLPRWHDKQRKLEYAKIDARLDRPEITFVPSTRLGRDIDFQECARSWGWSAMVLANGAWRDRPFEAENAEAALGNGLLYQNPFIYWFNHKDEAAYDGPRHEVPDGPICVGGGLASIDVIKVMQIEIYHRALQQRGIEVDVIEMEHQGIPATLAAHGIADPASLGVAPGTFIYRRRIEDMPVVSAPKGANETVLARLPTQRQKIFSICQAKFLFGVLPQTLPQKLVMEGGRVVGLQVQDTRVDGKQAIPVAGSERVLPTTLVVSSIGSIPEPIPGVEMQSVYYKFKDAETGEYEPIPGVFGTGNVVTGKGNIKASADNGKLIAENLAVKYLGLGNSDRDLSGTTAPAEAKGADAAEQVAAHIAARAPLPANKVSELLARAQARQREVGYDSYRDWMQKVTPADLQ